MLGALSPVTRPAPRSRRLALLAAAGLAACTALLGGPAAASVPAVSAPALSQAPPGGATTLGPRVVVFDPSMPVAQIQARADAIHAQQVDNEMGSARWSLLFKPGTYGTATQPLQIKVGYYTEVAGLGASPSDTVINGKVEVYNRCLTDGPSQPYCVALNNFWRSMSNLTIQVNGTGQDGCRASANFWAVSQASSLRRVDIRGGNLSLMDYCTAGPQFASGGYLADSRADFVVNGSQQQWITRNSEIGGWSNGVWNQVFAGTVGAPSEQGFPNPPYTTLERTSVSREKPFLFVDGQGAWQVRVPDARTSSRGPDWTTGTAAGRTLPLSAFHVATPADSATELASQLSRGKHLLLTPGIYDVDKSLVIRRDDTVVLGMGQATLTAVRGAVPLVVDKQAHGVVVAGVNIDAGTTLSPTLMQVGRPGPAGQHAKGADGIPSTTLNDVYFRVGGPHVGKADVSLQVDADDVLIDHAWVWRADHGIEGFTAGASGDTDRWRTNIGRVGLVVNGDRVHATGLFVEHYQQHNTIWNGEDGEVVLYQNELPYDPPSQAQWNRPDGTRGWTGFKVGDGVQRHRLFGGGVYVFNRNDPSIVTERGFEVPERAGVRLHHVLTVNLDAGAIEHVVNDTGARVDSTRSGQPSYVVDYPAP
ncbi:discoidin domain-containing protein [Knoellia locipacati]|uniref:Coagulation factor 5/8 type n=1 Tax=Knoellia locipacati TaxID=882824 RepID=A0A512SX95_9MICO|nr:adenylyl cyclase [Knoellia locipacati]GEQ12592.1 coagulation factor 5/8 type [Knoellia locipacati]